MAELKNLHIEDAVKQQNMRDGCSFRPDIGIYLTTPYPLGATGSCSLLNYTPCCKLWHSYECRYDYIIPIHIQSAVHSMFCCVHVYMSDRNCKPDNHPFMHALLYIQVMPMRCSPTVATSIPSAMKRIKSGLNAWLAAMEQSERRTRKGFASHMPFLLFCCFSSCGRYLQHSYDTYVHAHT